MFDNFDIHSFFDAMVKQDAEKLRTFFEPEAIIIWANTGEQFSVEEYIRANCEYPGHWQGILESCDIIKRHGKTVVFVASLLNSEEFIARTVSFINFGDTKDQKISYLTEYWGDIGEPPQWRQEKNIGKRYNKNVKPLESSN